MHEFRWQIPGPSASTVTLRLHARNGWFGFKSLYANDRRLYQRYWLAGIAHRFYLPNDGRRITLRLLQEGQGRWRPALFLDGTELPEQLGTQAPIVPDRPTAISAVTGLTYLAMLVALVMLLSIMDMLEAVKQPHADRKLVLDVRDPAMPDLMTVDPLDVDMQPQGERFTWNLQVEGGKAPFQWSPSRKHWPKGMTLDATSGQVEFTPTNASDYHAEYTVQDARGDLAVGALAVVVDPVEPPPSGWPTITTALVPVATIGEPYEFCLESDTEDDAYSWKRLSGSLPKGLKLGANGCLAGTPGFKTLATLDSSYVSTIREGAHGPELHDALQDAKIRVGDLRVIPSNKEDVWFLVDRERRLILRDTGDGVEVLDGRTQYAFTVSQIDTRYAPGQDLRPWILPFVATAFSLLGFWNMRRWGVLMLAVFLAVEIAFLALGVLPVAVVGMVLQGVILLIGLLHLGSMH